MGGKEGEGFISHQNDVTLTHMKKQPGKEGSEEREGW